MHELWGENSVDVLLDEVVISSIECAARDHVAIWVLEGQVLAEVVLAVVRLQGDVGGEILVDHLVSVGISVEVAQLLDVGSVTALAEAGSSQVDHVHGVWLEAGGSKLGHELALASGAIIASVLDCLSQSDDSLEGLLVAEITLAIDPLGLIEQAVAEVEVGDVVVWTAVVKIAWILGEVDCSRGEIGEGSNSCRKKPWSFVTHFDCVFR